MIRRVWSLVRKEVRQIVRDPSSIAIGVVLPVILILLFGYGLSLDVKDVPVAVVLEDPSPDAVELAADELMKKQTGRKALILLSDGVDNGSKLTLSDAVEAAQRADTLVYGILFADKQMFGGFGGRGRMGGYGVDGKKVLQTISQETGGRFFEVSGKEPIGKVYEAIEEDLRHQYSLGYTPDAGTGYRKIQLTVKKTGLIVQTRDGYYA